VRCCRLVDFVEGDEYTAFGEELGKLFRQNNAVAAVLSQLLHSGPLVNHVRCS